MKPTSLVVARLVSACAAFLVACSAPGPAAVAPATPTAAAATSPAPSATAAAAGPRATVPLTGPVDVERVMTHLRTLAVDIGIRDSGSENERRAARYIADVLTAQGYTTTIEPFTYPARYDDSTVTLASGTSIKTAMLDGSAQGDIGGVLVDGGTGQPEQLAGSSVRGAIVLMRRGGLPFAQKVANAQQAGALAVLVVNNEAGPFRGTLGQPRASIPALAIDGNHWDALRSALGQRVQVLAVGGTRSVTSQNVVGRRGDACRAYIGAHYDSVPAGPGANDNASGTASMLELARVRGTDGLCAIAFGSEETGLNGSQAYVTAQGVKGAKFLLNFDMMGRLDDPIIVGDPALTESILGIIGRGADQPLKNGVFPPFASSDHVSFSSVGVPAVTITSGDDPNIHTAGDTLEAVRKPDLQTMLRLGDAALEGLLKTLGGR
jgi:aminopeptidase YwaD